MKRIVQNAAWAFALAVLALQGCKPSLDTPSPSAGQADFTTYVAVGNSLTAGYESNGLTRYGQINSYPNILANAMMATGKGPAQFLQPLLPEGIGTGGLVLKGIVNGSPDISALGPDPAILDPASPPFKDVDNGLNIHNLGVPGIKVADVKTPGYGSAAGNPYFERILPDANASMTYLQYVSKRRPTFFTNWLGNNDVLAYASSGAAADALTDMPTFMANYKEVLDSLMRTAKGGLIATLPNVTSAPFFTTVGPAQVVLDDATAASLQNLVYARYNATAERIGRPELKSTWHEGPGNIPYIVDSSDATLAPLNYIRPLRPDQGELILLTAADTLGKGYGVAVGSPIPSPTGLPSLFVLTTNELAAITARTTEINDFIRAEAQTRGLALFDAETFLKQVKAGTVFFDGVQVRADFITGGAFSLDGVHPTPRGYAIVANEMMKAINAKYGSSLSPVNAVDYPGLTFPK